MHGRQRVSVLTLYMGAVYAFIYSPLACMVLMSFNDSISTTLPWGGFTVKWYQQTLNNDLLFVAFFNSARLGVTVAVLSSAIGLLVALAFRRAFTGKAGVLNMMLAPLLVPGIVLGVGQAIAFTVAGIPLSLWGSTLIGHLVYTVPFAFITIYPRVYKFDPNIEAAAMDLGAGPWVTFWTIVFPRILPGVVASMLFGFTLSFDEFIRTFFLVGAQNTLPMYLWSIILTNPSPETNAIATLVVAFSLALVLLGVLAVRRGWRQPQQEHVEEAG